MLPSPAQGDATARLLTWSLLRVGDLPVQDFFELSPEKFQNKTNGVTPRRWLAYCNPRLAGLITQTLGSDEWIKHADKLQGLKRVASDKSFQHKWRDIKHSNKERLAAKIKVCGFGTLALLCACV